MFRWLTLKEPISIKPCRTISIYALGAYFELTYGRKVLR
uniref:Uncharacterized protein n=1 Tax=Ciona intestinalis TaxID=7719 RepID=H2XTT9_CIOIN